MRAPVLERQARRRQPLGRNRLLQLLPTAEYERLAPLLTRVTLAARHVLSEPLERPRYVYFPQTAVLSQIIVLPDGAAVEAATVGNEGMVGLSAMLGDAAMTTRCLVQVAGEADRTSASTLRRAAAQGPAVDAVLRRYAQAYINQLAQSAACNRLHELAARCARWLLMTHDRVGADDFDLTQEFLSYMLGVRREGVSVAAHALQDARLIRYSRGRMMILDRSGLEVAACACYRTVQDDYARILG